MTKTTRTVLQVLSAVLVLVLVAGIIAGVYKYTDGFNDDFKTFYVEHDGKQILTTDNTMQFAAGAEQRFNVKYVFDGDEQKRDYSVKVVPNATTDFEYTVDGNTHLYSKTQELTKAFGITKQDKYFTLTLTHEMNIQNILKSVYGSEDAVVPKIVEDIDCPYLLVISSYNGKIAYNIKFGITGVDDIAMPPPDHDESIHGITLNYSAITF